MYYGRYPEPPAGDTATAPNRGEQFWYHALGASQDDDVLIYERPDEPDWGFSGGVSEDGSI